MWERQDRGDESPWAAPLGSCHLGWCVCRAFELESTQPLPRIALPELAARAQANQHLLVSLSTASLERFLEVMSLEMGGQPLVMQFVGQIVASELSNDMARNRQLLPELVAVFLAVKTVVDTLDAATN